MNYGEIDQLKTSFFPRNPSQNYSEEIFGKEDGLVKFWSSDLQNKYLMTTIWLGTWRTFIGWPFQFIIAHVHHSQRYALHLFINWRYLCVNDVWMNYGEIAAKRFM